MDNVITIEELPDYIDQVIESVHQGVAIARRRGRLAELPKEIAFDVVVVSRWQDRNLAVTSEEESTGMENSKDGGGSITVQESASVRRTDETTTGNESSVSKDTESANSEETSKDNSTSTDKEDSTGKETSKDDSTSTDTGTSKDTDNSTSTDNSTDTSNTRRDSQDISNEAGTNASYSYDT